MPSNTFSLSRAAWPLLVLWGSMPVRRKLQSPKELNRMLIYMSTSNPNWLSNRIHIGYLIKRISFGIKSSSLSSQGDGKCIYNVYAFLNVYSSTIVLFFFLQIVVKCHWFCCATSEWSESHPWQSSRRSCWELWSGTVHGRGWCSSSCAGKQGTSLRRNAMCINLMARQRHCIIAYWADVSDGSACKVFSQSVKLK